MTLTFNLLVARDSEATEIDPDEELAGLVGEHFATPATRRSSDEPAPAPNRLVVLLDHRSMTTASRRRRTTSVS